MAGLDSTDIVDEYTTDCVVIADQEMMQELVYVYVFLTSIAWSIVKEKCPQQIILNSFRSELCFECLVLYKYDNFTLEFQS